MRSTTRNSIPSFFATACASSTSLSHGQSPGKRGFAANGFANLVTDMDSFVRGLCQELDIPINNAVVIAHSVAAVTAATWVHDYNPGIRTLILCTPAFSVRLYVPLALPMLRIINYFKPGAKITSYVKGKLLTHDTEKAQAYDQDDNICKDISNTQTVTTSLVHVSWANTF